MRSAPLLPALWLTLEPLPKSVSGNLISVFIHLPLNKWSIFTRNHMSQFHYYCYRCQQNQTTDYSSLPVCLSGAVKRQDWQRDRQLDRQSVICGAVNQRWSDGADKHSDRSVARPPKPHVSRQECIARCTVGLCLWGNSADSLTHRTLWGWGMWRSEEEEEGSITFGNQSARSGGVCESQS